MLVVGVTSVKSVINVILFAWGVNAAIGYRLPPSVPTGGTRKGRHKKGRRRRRRKVLQSPRRSGKNEKVARAKPTYSLPLPPLESGAERVYFFFSGFPGWRDKYLDACPGTFSPNWILSPLLRGVSCRLICMSPVIFRAWAELTEIERQTLNRNFLAAAAICI